MNRVGPLQRCQADALDRLDAALRGVFRPDAALRVFEPDTDQPRQPGYSIRSTTSRRPGSDDSENGALASRQAAQVVLARPASRAPKAEGSG